MFNEEDKQALKQLVRDEMRSHQNIFDNGMNNYIHTDSYEHLPNSYNNRKNQLESLYQMIAEIAGKVAEEICDRKIEAAINMLIDKVYTNEDFERDIGLR